MPEFSSQSPTLAIALEAAFAANDAYDVIRATESGQTEQAAQDYRLLLDMAALVLAPPALAVQQQGEPISRALEVSDRQPEAMNLPYSRLHTVESFRRFGQVRGYGNSTAAHVFNALIRHFEQYAVRVDDISKYELVDVGRLAFDYELRMVRDGPRDLPQTTWYVDIESLRVHFAEWVKNDPEIRGLVGTKMTFLADYLSAVPIIDAQASFLPKI